MKAIVQDGYGSADVLEFRDVPDPVVGDDEVLVRVRAAGCGPDVWHLMTGQPYFARLMPDFRKMWTAAARPRRRRASSRPSARRVTDLKPGDEVMGIVEGSFAELAVGRADKLVRKPARLTLRAGRRPPDLGSDRPPGAPRRGEGASRGRRCSSIGAAGGVGTLAVQIAKAFGAQVTGVCSTSKADLVRSIGADDVIDYTREDFTDGSPALGRHRRHGRPPARCGHGSVTR